MLINFCMTSHGSITHCAQEHLLIFLIFLLWKYQNFRDEVLCGGGYGLPKLVFFGLGWLHYLIRKFLGLLCWVRWATLSNSLSKSRKICLEKKLCVVRSGDCLLRIAGFWSWAHFAPKLDRFSPEVRSNSPLKLGSKCWKIHTAHIVGLFPMSKKIQKSYQQCGFFNIWTLTSAANLT